MRSHIVQLLRTCHGRRRGSCICWHWCCEQSMLHGNKDGRRRQKKQSRADGNFGWFATSTSIFADLMWRCCNLRSSIDSTERHMHRDKNRQQARPNLIIPGRSSDAAERSRGSRSDLQPSPVSFSFDHVTLHACMPHFGNFRVAGIPQGSACL